MKNFIVLTSSSEEVILMRMVRDTEPKRIYLHPHGNTLNLLIVCAISRNAQVSEGHKAEAMMKSIALKMMI